MLISCQSLKQREAMQKEDSGSDIPAQELEQLRSSDSKNETEVNELDIAPSENPDTESMGNEKEKDEECEILEVGDSPNDSPASAVGAGADENSDQNSRDLQNMTEIKKDENGGEKAGPTSISLSTLISTIIKGTVASMDDVGREKQGSKGSPLSLSPGQIVSSSQLQDEALSSASDTQTDVTNPALQENTDEVLENRLPPAYDSVVDVRRRGPDRRPRMQHRFSLSRMGTYEEALEVPKTETIDTDGGKIYQCLSCKVSFNYEQDMQMHLQTHLRPRYFCPVCSKRFLNQSTLERHMVTHEQTKPFVCSICSQGFRIKSNLNRHYQRIHSSKVDLGEPRRGRPESSVPTSNMPSPEDTVPKPKFPIQSLGMVPRSIPHSYPSSPYRDSQIPVTNLATPQIDFHPTLRYEQASNQAEPETTTVSSAELIADFPQPANKLEFDQSPYTNVAAFENSDLQQIKPNNSLTQGRVTSINFGDEDDSHAHLFLSRYPDVESAVDAIRRIETERLFHQELLLEELKLRRKYGLPSSNVLEDLKKELALKEKIGDMDSLIAQGGCDFGRAETLKNAKPLIDHNSMIGTTSHRTSPNYDISFQSDPSRAAYLLGGQSGHQESDETTSRGIPSDLVHHGAQGLLNESQASAQLRRLSAFSTSIHSPYPPGSGKESPSNLNSTSDVQVTSPHISDESSNEWCASQYLKSFTPTFSRPRRGRRRLASLPSSFPSQYIDESEIKQQDASFQPRKHGSPTPFSKVMVHHRPPLHHNSSQAVKPPPILRPPPLPFRVPQNSGHRFQTATTLPPPPDYVPPFSPQRPMPKRFRPNLEKPIRTELQRLEDFTNQREIEPVKVMRTKFDKKPTQSSPVISEYGSTRTDTVSNPFTVSGPPNRSVKPSKTQSFQNPNQLSAFTAITQDSSSSPNHVSEEADNSPLDLSQKV